MTIEKSDICILVRQATNDDRFQIIRLMKLYFDFYSINHPGDDRINALLDVLLHPSEKGLGKALLQHCLTYVRSNGYAYMEWVTASDNAVAQKFYESQGAERSNWIVYSL